MALQNLSEQLKKAIDGLEIGDTVEWSQKPAVQQKTKVA